MIYKNFKTFVLFYVLFALVLISNQVLAQDEDDVVVYTGYFAREQNDGEMARMSGKSHYVKFYPENRFIRLYIPYPFSKTVEPSSIHKIFDIVNKKTRSDAFIKDDFGILDEKIIAHVDVVKRINGEIMFDCSITAPCKIKFKDNAFVVIKKGIVKDHVTRYDYVSD